MEKAMCGANCNECSLSKTKQCEGCEKSAGCPFGKKCFIYKYIKSGGIENFEFFKKGLIEEFNNLYIDGMPKVDGWNALVGGFVNLEYALPNGEKTKFLDDQSIYLGNQLECEFGGDRCFGIIAGLDFLLVCTYEENGKNPELVMYKKR